MAALSLNTLSVSDIQCRISWRAAILVQNPQQKKKYEEDSQCQSTHEANEVLSHCSVSVCDHTRAILKSRLKKKQRYMSSTLINNITRVSSVKPPPFPTLRTRDISDTFPIYVINTLMKKSSQNGTSPRAASVWTHALSCQQPAIVLAPVLPSLSVSRILPPLAPSSLVSICRFGYEERRPTVCEQW